MTVFTFIGIVLAIVTALALYNNPSGFFANIGRALVIILVLAVGYLILGPLLWRIP